MNNGRRIGWTTAAIVVLVGIAMIALGLLAVDTTMASILIGVGVATALVRGIVVSLRRRDFGRMRLQLVLLLILIAITGGLYIVQFQMAQFEGITIDIDPTGQDENPCPDIVVNDMRVILRVKDLKAGRLIASGQVSAFEPGFNDGIYTHCDREDRGENFDVPLGPVEVTAYRRGLWLREVWLDSRTLNVYSTLRENGYPSAYAEDVEMAVELPDWPRGTFFEGKSTSDLEVSQYLGTETVTWHQSSDRYIRFSYLPPATRFIRPLLTLSFRVGSLGEGVVAMGGMVGSLAVSWAFEALVGDRIRAGYRKVKGWRKQGSDEAEKPKS